MSEITHNRYVAPHFSLSIVEVESPICAGSVQFGGPTDKKITINTQDVVDATNNDFSGSAWEVDNTSSESN